MESPHRQLHQDCEPGSVIACNFFVYALFCAVVGWILLGTAICQCLRPVLDCLRESEEQMLRDMIELEEREFGRWGEDDEYYNDVVVGDDETWRRGLSSGQKMEEEEKLRR